MTHPSRQAPIRSHQRSAPLTVWPCGQRTDASRHDAVLPAKLAQRIVAEFSPEDGLVIDPFTAADGAICCAAVAAGRCAITISRNCDALDRARRALDAIAQPKGPAEFRCSDTDDLPAVLADVAGWVDLIATSPPYAFATPDGSADDYRNAIEGTFAGCASVLKAGGTLVTVTANTPDAEGRLIDLASLTVVLARQAGLRYVQHIVALRTRISGSDVGDDAAHSDVLVFAKPASAADPHAHRERPPSSPVRRRPPGLRRRFALAEASCGSAADSSTVWATAQKCSATQRRGRYVPEATEHPGKMLPAVAARVIARYSRPGDLILDPMCGIGTTLVEAVHQGRRALGVEYEPRWSCLAAASLELATRQGAPGHGEVLTGDARDMLQILGRVHGPVHLVLTSPPYGASTHGHVEATRDSGDPGLRKRHQRYSHDPANLAHNGLDHLLEGVGEILGECRRLLAPGGVVALTVRPFRQHCELIDFPGQVIEAAGRAGLILTKRITCLLCGVRGDQLVTRVSFFQKIETQRQRERGLPACLPSHEDLLIFRAGLAPGDRAGSVDWHCDVRGSLAPEDHACPLRRVRRGAEASSDPAASLQLGRCGECGKLRYGSRSKARRAARLLHPEDDLQVYRCRAGDCWHIGHSRPAANSPGSAS